FCGSQPLQFFSLGFQRMNDLRVQAPALLLGSFLRRFVNLHRYVLERDVHGTIWNRFGAVRKLRLSVYGDRVVTYEQIRFSSRSMARRVVLEARPEYPPGSRPRGLYSHAHRSRRSFAPAYTRRESRHAR